MPQTPKRWRFDGSAIVDQDGRIVAVVDCGFGYWTNTDIHKNGQLLATAHELLNAAKRVAKAYFHFENDDMAALEAAIAKATGAAPATGEPKGGRNG